MTLNGCGLKLSAETAAGTMASAGRLWIALGSPAAMRPSRLVVSALFLIALGQPARAGEIVLITQEEASLPAAAEVSLEKRAITRGPGVNQVRPGPDEPASTPLPLKISFVARNGVPIDPSSVRLTYLKRPNVDLTARIKPFITAEGVQIDRAAVPAGTHVLRIDVRDARGRTGAALIRLSAR